MSIDQINSCYSDEALFTMGHRYSAGAQQKGARAKPKQSYIIPLPTESNPTRLLFRNSGRTPLYLARGSLSGHKKLIIVHQPYPRKTQQTSEILADQAPVRSTLRHEDIKQP